MMSGGDWERSRYERPDGSSSYTSGPKMKGEVLCQSSLQFLLTSPPLVTFLNGREISLIHLARHQQFLPFGVSDMIGVKAAVGHLGIDPSTYRIVSLLTQT